MKQEHKLNDKLTNILKSLQNLKQSLVEIKSVEQAKVDSLKTELKRTVDNLEKERNGSQSKPVQ